MKHLVNKVITVKVPFMDDEVEVKKLSVGQILELQKVINKANKSKSEDSQIKLLHEILKVAVVGADTITDEEFNSFPMGELSALSEKILEISGLASDSGN